MTDAAEQTARQLRAAHTLTVLLMHAAETGLPPLSWTVGDAGCTLHGTTSHRPAAERRAIVGAWASALGVAVKTAFPGTGTERLVAFREQHADGLVKDPLVRIAVAADIWTDQEENADA